MDPANRPDVFYYLFYRNLGHLVGICLAEELINGHHYHSRLCRPCPYSHRNKSPGVGGEFRTRRSNLNTTNKIKQTISFSSIN